MENELAAIKARITESKETSSIRSSDYSPLCSLTAKNSTDYCLSSNPEEDCTICAKPIKNYEPEFFHGVEMNPACDDCKSPASETQISSELQDTKIIIFPIETTALNLTPVNNTSLDFNMNHPSMKPPNRLSHSSTTMETSTLQLNSPKLTKPEPSNLELSSQATADLLKEFEKAAEDLSSKLDESNLRCLDIRDALRKQSS